MKKTKFTESQIFGILKQQEQGQTAAAICREHGISQAYTSFLKSIQKRGIEKILD